MCICIFYVPRHYVQIHWIATVHSTDNFTRTCPLFENGTLFFRHILSSLLTNLRAFDVIDIRTPLIYSLNFYIKVRKVLSRLKYPGRVTHLCPSKLGYHQFRQWLIACPAPTHYVIPCWPIVESALRIKNHWNLNQNMLIFIQEGYIWIFCLQNGCLFVLP